MALCIGLSVVAQASGNGTPPSVGALPSSSNGPQWAGAQDGLDGSAGGWLNGHATQGPQGFRRLDAGEQVDLPPDLNTPDIHDLSVVWEPAGMRVRWKTATAANRRIDYGWAMSYGKATGNLETFTNNHDVLLTNLQQDTIYHLRVTSTTPSGKSSQSENVAFFTGPKLPGSAKLSGPAFTLHPMQLDFQGPFAKELDNSPNPFRDYRMQVRLRGPQGELLKVYGFFAGDGEGGTQGNIWRARFLPESPGLWTYTVQFREGSDISTNLDASGSPGLLEGESGALMITSPHSNPPGFYRHGVLEVSDGHYLRFRDGTYFLKGGTNSPENLLAYAGFDNTEDQPGGLGTPGLPDGLHRFGPHAKDFGRHGLGDAKDALFYSETTGESSRGIIGALNYLGSVHINSVYFLPMNLGGDGWDTYPYVEPKNQSFDKLHFDVSKLDQWNLVFEHAQREGILLHFVLAETEAANEDWLDGGNLGVERKLFFREMVARFGHLPALQWNLSEENDYSTEHLREFADYLRELDPYERPIAFHTKVLPSHSQYLAYTKVLGEERFGAASIQGHPEDAGHHVEFWRTKSEAAGRPWVVAVDELTPANVGLSDQNINQLRKEVLYDVYFSGGQIEWYAGSHPQPLGGDLNLEDFRPREDMWLQTWYARRFMQACLPYWRMKPVDSLVSGESSAYGGAEVFAAKNEVYAIYYPNASNTGQLNLTSASGVFELTWFNPRTGIIEPEIDFVVGGGFINVGAPPNSPNQDWVVLIKR